MQSESELLFLLQIHSSNFSKIPQLMEPLKTVFAEEIDEMNKTKWNFMRNMIMQH